MRDGFTLVEVIVALTVLEVGLLGVVGLALHAHTTLNDSLLRSRAVAATAEIADSLAGSGVRVGGLRSFPGGSISWAPGAGMGGVGGGPTFRRITIRARGTGGDQLFTVQAIVPSGDPGSSP